MLLNQDLNVPAVTLSLLVAFPGLISLTVYRLIMPARALEWTNAIVQGLFYSAVNFALSLPVLYWLIFGYDPLQHPVRYIAAAMLVLLLGPAVWPFVLVAIFKSKTIAPRIQIPYPTAWDFLFDQREPAFLLIHLTDGDLIGGYWGGQSYAGSFPNDGDIYMEAVYKLNEDGGFGERVANTRGVLLRKEQYSFIEMFDVPEET